jgi:hypothetical protein
MRKRGVHSEMARQALLSGEPPQLYRRAAQVHANKFWGCAIISAIVWHFAGWKWALIPVAIAILKAAQSISATMVATRLEKLGSSGESKTEV